MRRGKRMATTREICVGSCGRWQRGMVGAGSRRRTQETVKVERLRVGGAIHDVRFELE